MACAGETTLTFFIMYLSPLMSEVYLFVNLFEESVHNAVFFLLYTYINILL